MRAAMVGGAAYYAGKKVQQGRDDDAAYDDQGGEGPEPAQAGSGLTNDSIEQLKQLADLKSQGVLTEEEFQQQKQKILEGS